MSKESHSEKKKILLAEDDNSLRRYIEVILTKENYKVFAAQDGLAALEIIMSNEIDAIIADDLMPNLTGFELFRTLNRSLEFQAVPFIIMSGKNSFEETEVEYFLIKDVTLHQKMLAMLSNIFST
jgi:DNA-binding response OmpR family regulator